MTNASNNGVFGILFNSVALYTSNPPGGVDTQGDDESVSRDVMD